MPGVAENGLLTFRLLLAEYGAPLACSGVKTLAFCLKKASVKAKEVCINQTEAPPYRTVAPCSRINANRVILNTEGR